MRYWPLIIASIYAVFNSHTACADEFSMDLSPLVVDSAMLAPPDSIDASTTGTYAENDWLYRLKHKQLDIEDPSVRWPSPFVAWCIGAYNWINRTFNRHDPEWVKGDGYNFKALLLSDNWVDTYTFNYKDFPSLSIWDRMYPNLGAYIKYLGISLGYSVDMGTIFNSDKSTHRKFTVGLSCAKFSIEALMWESNVSTHIRAYGDIHNFKLLKIPYDGLKFSEANISAFYYFNNKKFSLGAVHSFSNNQLKSAGSAIAGFSFNLYGAEFDFTELAEKIPDFQKYPFDYYNFHYRTYNLMGGYSYNWVLNRHLVFNITAIPGAGIVSTAGDSTIGQDILMSLYGKGMMGLLYTYKRLFVGLRGTITGNAFLAKDVTFTNTLQNYQLAVGIKF